MVYLVLELLITFFSCNLLTRFPSSEIFPCPGQSTGPFSPSPSYAAPPVGSIQQTSWRLPLQHRLQPIGTSGEVASCKNHAFPVVVASCDCAQDGLAVEVDHLGSSDHLANSVTAGWRWLDAPENSSLERLVSGLGRACSWQLVPLETSPNRSVCSILARMHLKSLFDNSSSVTSRSSDNFPPCCHHKRLRQLLLLLH